MGKVQSQRNLFPFDRIFKIKGRGLRTRAFNVRGSLSLACAADTLAWPGLAGIKSACSRTIDGEGMVGGASRDSPHSLIRLSTTSLASSPVTEARKMLILIPVTTVCVMHFLPRAVFLATYLPSISTFTLALSPFYILLHLNSFTAEFDGTGIKVMITINSYTRKQRTVLRMNE